MLLAPRYSGTDLPVFDASDERMRRNNRTASDTEDSTFIRLIHVNTIARRLQRKGLPEVLAKADAELAMVAELCDAVVIEHTWGLYRPDAVDLMDFGCHLPKNPQELRIPAGLLVAAEVDVVRDPQMLRANSPIGKDVQRGLQLYAARRLFMQHRLVDMEVGQFVIGQTDHEPSYDDADTRPKLVDIEPRMH